MVRSVALRVYIPAVHEVVADFSVERGVTDGLRVTQDEGVYVREIAQCHSLLGHPLRYRVGAGFVISDVVAGDDGLVAVSPVVVCVEVSCAVGVGEWFIALNFLYYVERPS